MWKNTTIIREKSQGFLPVFYINKNSILSQKAKEPVSPREKQALSTLLALRFVTF